MSTRLAQPFQINYNSSVPSLLHKLGCSIAISTYQAGKVVFLSAQSDQKLIQLPRTFLRPMGLAIEADRLAVACKDEVILLRNSTQLAWHYPKKPQTYDGMFLPRATFHTGEVDVHDLDFTETGLAAVNTNFSCIIQIDTDYSFTPIWKPDFISKVTAGDHCHLNGMAVSDSKIKYVSAFASTDSPRAWTSKLMETGIIIDYDSKAVVLEGLAMPHSPRIYKDYLYVLLSGTGELIKVNMTTYEREIIFQQDGFLRGLAIHEGYAFVGLSKIREDSSSFGKLSIAAAANTAGVVIIELASGQLVGQISYLQSVDEIYDVQVLAGLKRPSILNTSDDYHKKGLSLPETTFWGVAKEKE